MTETQTDAQRVRSSLLLVCLIGFTILVRFAVTGVWFHPVVP